MVGICVCFSDRKLESKIQMLERHYHYIPIIRELRKHKLLPHRLFTDYEYSLWIDGNINVIGDVNELLSNLDDVVLRPLVTNSTCVRPTRLYQTGKLF